MPDPHRKLEEARAACEVNFTAGQSKSGSSANIRYQYDVTCVATRLGYIKK